MDITRITPSMRAVTHQPTGRIYNGAKLDWFNTLDNCPCNYNTEQLLQMGWYASTNPASPYSMADYAHNPSYAAQHNALLQCGTNLVRNFMDSQCGGIVAPAPFALLCMYVQPAICIAYTDSPTVPFTESVTVPYTEHWPWPWPQDYGAPIAKDANGNLNTWPMEKLLCQLGYHCRDEHATLESGFAFAIAAACTCTGA